MLVLIGSQQQGTSACGSTMAPTKRKSQGGESSPKTPANDSVTNLASELTKALGRNSLPDYAKHCLGVLDKAFTVDGGLAQYMMDAMGKDEVERVNRAAELERAYPPSADWQSVPLPESGMFKMRPWMLAVKKSMGNKGFLCEETCRILVSLILVRGFRTDSSSLIGVEALAVEPAREEGYTTPTLGDYEHVGCGGVAFIKGWTRSVCFLFVRSLDWWHLQSMTGPLQYGESGLDCA